MNNKKIFKNLELKEYKSSWFFFKELDQKIKNDENLFPKIKNINDFIDKKGNIILEEYEKYILFEKMIFWWDGIKLFDNDKEYFYYLKLIYNKIKYGEINYIFCKNNKIKFQKKINKISKEKKIIIENMKKIQKRYTNKENYIDKFKWNIFLINVLKNLIFIIELKRKPIDLTKKWKKNIEGILNKLITDLNFELSLKNFELKEKLTINYQELVISNKKLVEKTEELVISSEKSTNATQKIAKDNQKQIKHYKIIAWASIFVMFLTAIGTILDFIFKLLKWY